MPSTKSDRSLYIMAPIARMANRERNGDLTPLGDEKVINTFARGLLPTIAEIGVAKTFKHLVRCEKDLGLSVSLSLLFKEGVRVQIFDSASHPTTTEEIQDYVDAIVMESTMVFDYIFYHGDGRHAGDLTGDVLFNLTSSVRAFLPKWETAEIIARKRGMIEQLIKDKEADKARRSQELMDAVYAAVGARNPEALSQIAEAKAYTAEQWQHAFGNIKRPTTDEGWKEFFS